MSIGSNMPVEALASKTSAIKATMIMLMPLIPDLDRPSTKAAVVMVTISNRLSWESMSRRYLISQKSREVLMKLIYRESDNKKASDFSKAFAERTGLEPATSCVTGTNF